MASRLPVEEGYFTVPDGNDDPVRLIGSYSPQAGEYFFPRRRRCPVTGGPVEDRLLSPGGVLYSWTFVPGRGDPPGAGYGQVDLPEGVRVQARITGTMGDWTIGMPMRTAVRPVGTDADGIERVNFCFSPAASPAASAAPDDVRARAGRSDAAPATSRKPPKPIEDAYVIGVGIHRVNNEGVPVLDMAFEAATQALADAGVDFRQVESLYNGFMNAGQGTSIWIAKELGMTGVPVTHVENLSATGSTAFREAVLSVASGRSEIAMALAYDGGPSAEPSFFMHPTMGMPPRGPDGRPAPSVFDAVMPAGSFGLWAVRRMHEVGTTQETLAQIAAKNWNHARHNPYARRRADHDITVGEVLGSTMQAFPHTSMMSAATGGGAACAIVASRSVAERVARARPLVKVVASELQSEHFGPGHVFMGAVVGEPDLTRSTAAAAYEQAGIGPPDVDLVQVHDAFPIEELVYYELLGICPDGEGDKLVVDGATRIGGRIPFSTDGGLIGRGHPVGPTGLMQIWETTQQLRGESGVRQVEGARVGLAQMVGAGSVCIVHILQRA